MSAIDEFRDEVLRAARDEATTQDPRFFQHLRDTERAAFDAGSICGLTATLKRLGIKDGAALEKHLDDQERR